MSQPNSPVDPSAQPTPAARTGQVSGHTIVQRILSSREFSVVIVLVILCLGMLFTPARSTFFSVLNAENTLRNIAFLSIFAIGETIVIITGGIDLSLGSLIAFTGMLVAFLITRLSERLVDGMAISLAMLLTLIVAFGLGGIHATLIHRVRLPPFVVTLASLKMLRSLSLLMNNQLPISIANLPVLSYLANGNLFENSIFPIPIPLIIMTVVAVITSIALTKLRVGRYLYSIGSNEVATELSGVNVYKVKLFAYGVSGLLGGLAGILFACFEGQGNPQAGQAAELEAVAASVVGGANLMGGQGSVIGTVLGATLLYVIFSAINLTLSNSALWRDLVVGGVLLFAVLVSAFQQMRRSRA